MSNKLLYTSKNSSSLVREFVCRFSILIPEYLLFEVVISDSNTKEEEEEKDGPQEPGMQGASPMYSSKSTQHPPPEKLQPNLMAWTPPVLTLSLGPATTCHRKQQSLAIRIGRIVIMMTIIYLAV